MLSVKETSGDFPVQPLCPKQDLLEPAAMTMCSHVFLIAPRMEISQPLWEMFNHLHTQTQCFSYVSVKFLVQFMPLDSWALTGYCWQESGSVFFTLCPIRDLSTLVGPSWVFLSLGTVPALPASPGAYGRCSQSFDHLCGMCDHKWGSVITRNCESRQRHLEAHPCTSMPEKELGVCPRLCDWQACWLSSSTGCCRRHRNPGEFICIVI